MQKAKSFQIQNVLYVIIFVSLILLGCRTITYGKIEDIDPNIFIYTSNSNVGAYYDEKSDCFIFQTTQKQKDPGSQTFFRGFLYEFSRIKEDVNPYDKKYQTTSEATVTGNDPHYYVEVNSADGKAKNVNGKYYEREYIAFDNEKMKTVNDTYVNNHGETWYYSTSVIDKNSVLTAIQEYYPDWHAELEEKRLNGEKAYLGVDSVFLVNSLPSVGWGWNTYVLNETERQNAWTGAVFLSNAHTWGIDNYYRWSNWEDVTVYGLGPIRHGIYTYFNSYIEVCTDIKIEEPDDNQDPNPDDTPDPDPDDDPDIDDIPDDDIDIVKTYAPTNIEKIIGYNGSYNLLAAPSVYTYNTSDEFDLGIAIPSTESYTNGIEVSPWYGSVKITKHDVSVNVKIPYVLISTKKNEVRKEIKIRHRSKHAAGEFNGIHYPETYDTQYITVNGETYMYYVYTCWYLADDNEVVYYEGDYEYAKEGSYYAVEEVNLFAHDISKVENDFSQTLYDIGISVPYDITINGQNANSSDKTKFETTKFISDTDYHVDIPEALNEIVVAARVTETIQNSDDAKAYVEAYVMEQIGDAQFTTRNDYLSLDGRIYLNENGIQFTPVEEDVYVSTGSGDHMQLVKDEKYYITSATDDMLREEKTVTIPAETQNDDYYTFFRVDYKNFAAGDTLVMLQFNGNADGKPGIKDEYKENEPIRVHTPVISPISIKGEDKTQLVPKVQSLETQLILDNTYTVTFDWDTYFEYKGYTKENFENYVKKKEVSFPFDVVVNGKLYKASESSGRTEWIDVGNVNHFDFYIPSWANEGIYGSDNFKDYEYYSYEAIQARVYAINYIEDETEKWQEVANTDRIKYMAQYDYAVQVSGVIYDFQVVSINDALMFGGDKIKDIYSFVTNKEDKKFGSFNRFGENLIRYTLDGTLADKWNEHNILPLAAGSSAAYKDAGTLFKGHTIGFTLKTISNLNGKKDTIVIVPNYRYVTPEGKEIDVNVYFTLGNGPYTSIYDDTFNRKTYIGSPYFENCYYDYGKFNPVSFTADYFNSSLIEVLYRETESHNAGEIVLHSTQKLLTGLEEELTVNKAYDSKDCHRFNDELLALNNKTMEEFHASMQTWYGQYTIPTNIFVCEKYEDGTDAYQKAMEEDGFVSDTSDIWLDDGFLVLNFDITSNKNGNVEDLRYEGGTLNMWETENGGSTGKDVEIKHYDPVTKEETITTIPVEDGDVAVIDIGKKMSDKYSIGILYLN